MRLLGWRTLIFTLREFAGVELRAAERFPESGMIQLSQVPSLCASFHLTVIATSWNATDTAAVASLDVRIQYIFTLPKELLNITWRASQGSAHPVPSHPQ